MLEVLFNLQCDNVALQVEEKCCPYYWALRLPYSAYAAKTETLSFQLLKIGLCHSSISRFVLEILKFG